MRLIVEKIRIANSNVKGRTKYIVPGPSSKVGPGSKACITQGSRVAIIAVPIDNLQRRDMGVSQKTIIANGAVIDSRGAHIIKPWIELVAIWVARSPVTEDLKSSKYGLNNMRIRVVENNSIIMFRIL